MVIPRLAGLELSRPIAARYLWDILFRVYLLKIGRPTSGARCRCGGGENGLAHAGCMRRKGLSLHRFGGVGGAAGRIPFAAGELGALCTLAPWPKYMAAGTRVNGGWFWPRGQTVPLGRRRGCAAYLRKHVCRRECTAAGEKIGVYDLFFRSLAPYGEKIGQIPLFFRVFMFWWG